MMMLEKNHLEIAAFIASWLEDNVEHEAKGEQRLSAAAVAAFPRSRSTSPSPASPTYPEEGERHEKRYSGIRGMVVAALMLTGVRPATAQFYTQHNLVSDGAVPADHSIPT